MDESSPLKKDWCLTQEDFNELLLLLSPNPQLAGEKYETIRSSLITFLECRGCHLPEDYADIIFNRVAKKLREGTAIYTNNLMSFFYGVARMVLKEYWNEPARNSVSFEDDTALRRLLRSHRMMRFQEKEDLENEHQLSCLEKCMGKLPQESRDLIIEYYKGTGGGKIKNRKALAKRLNIPINALRIRALRIREKIEDCVRKCLQQIPT